MKQVAGGVIKNKNGEIAVVCQLDGTFWTLPQGHLDEHENALEGALREIKEETGLTDINFLKPLPSYTRNLTSTGGIDVVDEERSIHLFLFSTSINDLKSQDPDIQQVKWVKKSEVVNVLSHSKDREYFQSIIDLI
jgi:8-oxo-dGTP pyrophosphatase MutT (NUDIX family)